MPWWRVDVSRKLARQLAGGGVDDAELEVLGEDDGTGVAVWVRPMPMECLWLWKRHFEVRKLASAMWGVATRTWGSVVCPPLFARPGCG